MRPECGKLLWNHERMSSMPLCLPQSSADYTLLLEDLLDDALRGDLGIALGDDVAHRTRICGANLRVGAAGAPEDDKLLSVRGLVPVARGAAHGQRGQALGVHPARLAPHILNKKIGRASCRERV